MNEKIVMEIDSAEGGKVENVELDAELDYGNAEPKAEDALENADGAEDKDLAFEDEDVPAEDAEGFAEDKEALAENADIGDLEELKRSFPELADMQSISELKHPERYAKFRALGLTPREAFLATGQVFKPKRSIPSSPISVSRQRDGIPGRELKFAREIFPGLCDREIQELYKKVAK